jgi:membrane protein
MGGVVVAIVFEVAKKSFSAYITAFPSYQLIYGAFAAVPLFLLWIYMSWLILLVGAEIIHGLSIYKPNWKPVKSRPVITLLGVLSSLYKAQRNGEGVELSELQSSLSYAHEQDMDMALTWLLDEKVVVNFPSGELMLSRDVSSFTLYDLLVRFPWPLPAPGYVGDNNASQQWLVRFSALLEVHQSQQIELLNVSLKAFFDEDESEIDKES